MAVVKREFSKSSKGEQAYLYEITNTAGMKAVVSDFGATLVSLYVPDKDGKMRDIVWGCDDVAGYEGDKNPYFGATVGRIANRVGDAIVTINGVVSICFLCLVPRSRHVCARVLHEWSLNFFELSCK